MLLCRVDLLSHARNSTVKHSSHNCRAVHHVVLLVITLFILTSTAAAFGPRDQELMLLDGIDPLNPFPAGLSPVPTIPFLYKYQEPAVPSNAYRGVYGWTTCASDMLIRPGSTAELSAAIKDIRAKAAAQGRPLKMRATRPGFATMHSMPCASQPSNPSPFLVKGKTPMVVGIMMDKMTDVLSVDQGLKQLRVQAQMKLKGLYEAAEANQMSTPRSALPWWQGLTLAGTFSTTSHGSGFNATSMLCDWFVDVTWVDASGTVRTSAKGSEEARALCGGLGLLGTITEFTLQMTETTNTWFSTWYLKDDTNMAEDIDKMLQITPHLVVMWRPDIGKYTGHLQRPPPPGAKVTHPDARCNVIPQANLFVGALSGPNLRDWQNDYANRGSMYYTIQGDSISCTLAMTSAVGATWVTKPGHLPNISIPIFEGVAPTIQVTSTECGNDCAFINPKMYATAADVEFAFEKERLPEWIADIKHLIKKDLRSIPGWFAHRRCLMPGYYVMRFGRTPDSLLGNAVGLKAPVYTQQQMLVSRATPGVNTRYEWVQEAYEQLTLCKYEGRPHTGKNWDRTFTNPRCPLSAASRYGANLQKMSAMQDKFDPDRVFEPELWQRVVSGQGYSLKPKCVLERSCYCEADEHCGDGFICVPSIAFPQFKQCRPRVMN